MADFTHQDWDIIGTALQLRVNDLEAEAARGVKGSARRLAQTEAAARKADAMFLETYPEAPAATVDDGGPQ